VYAFTSDGKLWRGTYIDGIIGTMEEQVCDIPTDKDEYGVQAYMTMDGSIIYKIDYRNSSISLYTGKVYVFAKQEDNSWKLIDNITSSSPVDNQYFGIDMCMNADNSKLWISQYKNGAVDRFDIATGSVTLDANSTDPFGDGSLKHFWKLDGNLEDSVGGGTFDTIGTITYENAKFNKGAKLADLGDMYINENVFASDGTVNMWVNLTQYKDDMTLFATHNVDSTSQYVTVVYCMSDGRIQIAGRESNDDAFTRYITFNGTIPLNQLTMLTILKTDNSIKVYQDNILLGSVSKSSFTTTAFKTHFGYNSTGDNADGTTFDHIQIFDRILTEDEITQLYNAKNRLANNLDSNSLDPFNDGSLKHFYKLDGGVIDSIGSAHGTLVGNPTFENNKLLVTQGNYATISPTITSSFTIAFKVLSSDLSPSYSRALGVGKYTAGDDDFVEFGLNYNNSVKPYFKIEASGNNENHFNVDDISAVENKEYHVVMTYDSIAKEFKGYIDSSLKVTAENRVLNPMVLPLNIGASVNDVVNTQSLIGSIDHLQIFDRALTQEEIIQLYNAEVK
jgi:hypothetical protein